MKKIRYLVTILTLILATINVCLASSHNDKAHFGDQKAHNMFLGVGYQYPFYYDSGTKGNIATTDDTYDFVVGNNTLDYQSQANAQLTLGYHVNSWLSFALSFQQLTTTIDTKNSITSTNDTETRTSGLLGADMSMSVAIFKSFIHLGDGFRIADTSFMPFLSLGVGINRWQVSNAYTVWDGIVLKSSSGNNFAAEVGVGLKNKLGKRINLEYGLNYLYLGEYETGTAGYGSDSVATNTMKQSVDAKLSTLSPYINVSYLF